MDNKNKRFEYELKNNLTSKDRVESKNYDSDDTNLIKMESSLTTISDNFKYFLTNIVNPKVIDVNNNTIPVQIKYESGEDIVDIQKQGYIRDNKTNKPITPLVTFKRLSIEKEKIFPTILKDKSRVVISQTSNPNDIYLDYNDKEFNPVNIYYTVAVPDFVTIPFELNIWTDTSYAMDYILERMYYYEGAYYGKTSTKSEITITDSTINIMKDVDNQRLVRSSVSFMVKGKLILSDLNTIKNVTKQYSIRNIKIDESYE